MITRRGSVATFYCFADGSPKPELFWRRGDVYLKPGQSFGKIQVLQDGTLEVIYVQIIDDGVYTCIATNNMSQPLISEASLTVTYPPVIVNISSNVTATRHGRLTLQCEVKGSPMPTVKWITSDSIENRYSEMMTQDGMHYLSIDHVQNSHEGRFICEARNKYGTARKDLFVNVEGKR